MGRRVALMLVTRASASAPRSNADVFDTIYKHRGWGGDGVDASLSGSGSSLANTKRLCGLLGQLVHEASQNATVVTFLDAPMGDWFWMSRCLPSMAQNLRNGGRLVYQGVDVSATALAHADRRRNFVAAGEPHGRSTSFRADRPRTPGCLPPDPGKTLTQVL